MYFNDVIANFPFLMKGLEMTLGLAIIAILGSFFIGVVLGVLRYSKILIISNLATLYIEVVRSIPLILFIIFIHFGFLPYFLGVDVSYFTSAAISLTIFTSAYVAEIIRGGLNSIEKANVEAAKSLGLNRFQQMIYVILPISISRMTPALVSQFVSLIKDTSLASTIGLIELTRSGEIIYERTYHEFEILIFIALVYFSVCFSISLISKNFEKRTHRYE